MEISRVQEVLEREDEGIAVPIKDADGETVSDVTVTVAGSYSSKFRKAEEKRRDSDTQKRLTSLTAAEVRKRRAQLLAECIISWEGLTDQGKPYPFTKQNAVAWLVDAPWIMAQLEEAMYDHASFFSKPAPNS